MAGALEPTRLDWPPILDRAKDIVATYDTGVTLRQLFYRLVAAGIIPNTQAAYKTLSNKTAKARREGAFPDLIDRTRRIHRDPRFQSPGAALAWLAASYRRDRTEGQDVSLYLGVEKDGMVTQLEAWFGHLGLPILALGGYSSQTFTRQVGVDARRQRRPAVLLYGGDFDASGEDIDRDFIARTGCFSQVVRVALSEDQVDEHRLPPQPGKATDSRANGFVARHGRLVQVELDALPPEVLRGLYQSAIDGFMDMSTYHAALEREDRERGRLRALEVG
jgi:hypothetical protein